MSRLAREVLRGLKKGASDADVSRATQVKELTLPGRKKKNPDGVEDVTIAVREEGDSAAQQATPEPTLEPGTPESVAPVKPSAEPAVTAPEPEPPIREVEVKVATAQEAKRIDELSLDDFDTDDSFQPNFDTFETTDDVTAVVADLASRNAVKIDEARRGTITEEQLRGLANDLDIEDDVVRSIMERETGSLDSINAEKIVAARQVLNRSAERIKELAEKIHKGEGSDLERLQFRRQLMLQREFANNFLENFMGVRAEAGRLLNAFGVPTEGVDVDIRHLREMVEAAAGHDTEQIAKAIALMDNPSTGQISELTRRYTQSKFSGVVNEVFVNSILSGLKTHGINVAGNVMMQSMSIVERAVAARIGRFLSGEDNALIGETSALIMGQLHAWKEAFLLAGRSARTGVALDDVVKFEGVRRRSITGEHLLSPEQRNTPIGQAVQVLLDGYRVSDNVVVPGVGQIVRAPTERVMLPVDEFFKTLAYRSELTRLAFREAQKLVSAGDLAIEDVAQHVRNFMENPGTDLIKAADDYSRVVTFQNSLGDFGSRAQLLLRSKPILSLIAPFVRTPANIFKAGILDRSPIALFRSEFWRTMKAGGEERDLMLARVSMGTLTSGIIASMTVDGSVTGGGPSNPDARRLLEKDGWQPYSFRLPDGTYVSYRRLEPIAFVIGATADSVEILEALNNAPEGFHDDERSRVMTEIVPSIVTGIANNTLSKTYLQGIVDFMEAMSDPQRNMAGYLDRMAVSLTPFSAARRNIAGMDDPYLREARTLLDKMKVNSGIPGWSEEAPPSRDIFGDPRRKAAGSVLGVMSPIPETKDKNDPVVEELIGLMETTRRVPVSMPFHFAEGMRLTTEEYDELVVISRMEPAPNGRTFREELDRVMASGVYLDATPDRQVELVKDVQSRYDEYARTVMERENRAGFTDRIVEWRRQREALRFGER